MFSELFALPLREVPATHPEIASFVALPIAQQVAS